MVFCTHFKQILPDRLIGSNGTSVFFVNILQATTFIVCEQKDFL